MNEENTTRIIEDYIKKIARLLPDNFETEDLLEDLKAHINEGLENKIKNRPSESKRDLLYEVLDDLGTPEEIVEEYGIEQIQEPVSAKRGNRFEYYVVRLLAAFVVAVLAAWIVSIITEGAVDFYFAVVVLLAFAVIEWFVRAKQIGE
ncbi:hypothetical protein EU527_01165 [Candidatus Thorarchaeota archaeon]|nr:MAG: hypothetical protein EU527_01165 [Candidatus Thorarchaeota archaeon]